MSLRQQPVARDFFPLALRQHVLDRSRLSSACDPLLLDVHEERLAERRLVSGERIEVDASIIETNAATCSIRCPGIGRSQPQMLAHFAQESGLPRPTAAGLKRLDRTREGRWVRNALGASPSDPDADAPTE